MKVRIQVIIESGSGETHCVEEVAQFERGELRPDALGMTLAEAKALLQNVQRAMVAEQATTYLEAHSPCPACQAPRRCKGHHQLVYRTVFGKLTLPSPRWYACGCHTTERRSFSPLAELLQEHTTPELLYLEAKFAALMSYGLTVDVLGEILPIGAQLNATTVQGLNPTSALSGAISTTGPVWMKENSAFSFIVKRDSLVQRPYMMGPWYL
jgi:hypothetical protein